MDDIKKSIREAYGKIATEAPRESCCGSGSRIISKTHYDTKEIGELQIADLGLGCGNPAAYSDIQAGMTILDLGSGAGIDAFIASKYVGPSGKVIGLDMTEQMILRAKDNAAKLNISNVEFRLGEIERMPVESASIDRILSNCVINLIPDKRRAFREMYRVLKPGGAFIISDMVTTGTMPDKIRDDPQSWAKCVAGALDKGEYLGIASECGFRNIEVLSEKQYKDISSETFELLSITVKATK